MELSTGRMVGKYQVERLLGRGGMASVWRVRHADLGTPHALKVIEAEGPRELERFRAEGRLMARVRHPNVLGVIDVVDVDGYPGLVLEYVDGPPLDRLIASHRLTAPQIDEVARGILKGVRAAHRAGLVHRDLKPANVLMERADNRFVPKVADFGLAKVVSGDTSLRRTRSGVMLGTPAYMAPEQFRDAASVDGRADVYALGVMLYELCTGRLPYEGDDLVERFDVLRNRRYPPVAELRPDLPPSVGRAIEGAMAMEPRDRFATVDHLYDAWVQRDLEDGPTAPWDASTLSRFDTKAPTAPGPSLGATYALDDSVPPGGRPSPWLALTGLGVGAFGLAAVAAAGLVAVGIVAAVALSGPEGEPARASDPVPAAPTPETAPPAPPSPDPPPKPAAPAVDPRPGAPAPPAPAPVPVVRAPTAPAPTTPAPAAPAPTPSLGTVRVAGDATFQLWNAVGDTVRPGALPPGRYRWEGRFATGEPMKDAIQLGSGENWVIRCVSPMGCSAYQEKAAPTPSPSPSATRP